MKRSELKALLDDRVLRYNRYDFIEHDPIGIPHRYSLQQDIEITAFWTAIIAWGQRVTIINKATELFDLMDGAPYDFVKNHQEHDRARFVRFKHRTFNYTDTLYFLDFLQRHYNQHDSLEDAFLHEGRYDDAASALTRFERQFFDCDYAPQRTRKHVATPARKSTCKRLNMFLRWMVRQDDSGVDFGLWDRIPTSALMIPLDVHVERVARHFRLIRRKQRDWLTVEELTRALRRFDPDDPVRYDFALFGMGVTDDQ